MKLKIGETSFVKINNKHFQCKCGGFLFTYQGKNIFKCNGCDLEYEGEK